MQVRFPNDNPVYDGAHIVVRFIAEVDRELVVCEITGEALEDHFGAESALEDALIDAFVRGRKRIHSICARALKDNDGAPVVLHSGLFRTQML
jgi:hypothetical protein